MFQALLISRDVSVSSEDREAPVKSSVRRTPPCVNPHIFSRSLKMHHAIGCSLLRPIVLQCIFKHWYQVGSVFFKYSLPRSAFSQSALRAVPPPPQSKPVFPVHICLPLSILRADQHLHLHQFVVSGDFPGRCSCQTCFNHNLMVESKRQRLLQNRFHYHLFNKLLSRPHTLVFPDWTTSHNIPELAQVHIHTAASTAD